MMERKRVQRFLNIVILMIFALFLQDCKKENGTESSAQNITAKTWTLEYIENTGSHFVSFFPDIPNKITIEFAGNKQLLFDGVCNTGTGNYAVENDKLTISSLIITEIYCDNSNWETVTVQNLLKASTIELKEGKLLITSNGDFNLIFE